VGKVTCESAGQRRLNSLVHRENRAEGTRALPRGLRQPSDASSGPAALDLVGMIVPSTPRPQLQCLAAYLEAAK